VLSIIPLENHCYLQKELELRHVRVIAEHLARWQEKCDLFELAPQDVTMLREQYVNVNPMLAR